MVRRSAGPLPATAPPFFRASNPPRAASGPRSPARSLGRALRRPPVCPARARRRPDDAAAAGGAAAALGGPESPRSRSVPRATEGGRSRRGCSPRSGGGEESGPRRGRGGGEESGPGVRGRGGRGGGSPRASGREAGTRPPPRRKRSGRGMRGGSGSWRGGDASSGACHVAYRLRAGDSGRRAGGRAGGGQGPAGLHRLDAAQAGPSGVRGGRPARARLPDPPALFRPHLDPAGHHRPGGQGASPDHACRPLHLGSVHLERDLFLEIATGSVRYREGGGGDYKVTNS